MAVGESEERPRKNSKKKTPPKPPEFFTMQVSRLSPEHRDDLTDICSSEGVSYELQATINENEKNYYNFQLKHEEKCFLEWVAYLVKTKVYHEANLLLL